MENDDYKIGNYFNCYKEPKGYYLDSSDSLYKKCYNTCETCKMKGDNKTHNCLECNTNYSFGVIVNNNYKNCYKNCSYYHYFDSENIYHCTTNYSCPNEFSKLIQETNECIKEEKKIIQTTKIIREEYPTTILDNLNTETINTQNIVKITIEIKVYIKAEDIKELMQNIIKYENTTKDITKEEETEFYDNIVSNVEDILTSENFNTSSLDGGDDQVIQTEKMTITLTTSQNQRNNTNNNISTIDLGEI